MNAVKVDVDYLVEVMSRHRSWLAYSELDLLHDLERQAWSGRPLDEEQRIYVRQLIQRAQDRRAVAISLSEPARRH